MEVSKKGDITALGGLAKNAQAPIHIYDENGKLYNIVGKGLPGKPISLQHTKTKMVAVIGRYQEMKGIYQSVAERIVYMMQLSPK